MDSILYWVVLAVATVLAVCGWVSSTYWRNDSDGHQERYKDIRKECDCAYDRAKIAEHRLSEFRKMIGSFKDS